MQNGVREFILVPADDARPPGNGLPPMCDPRFSVVKAGPSRTLRRTWLDTFDWRLFRAGLNLECTAGRGRSELVLTARDGEPVAAEVARGLRWPAMIDDLPVGPLREHLAPIVGVRALLPVAPGGGQCTSRIPGAGIQVR